ncbi:MAG: molybdate ABC transporter periplasmic substrate-binding protein [Candidatus Methanofastidiosum methylothiophilum]|uniref:Molybdate ABC transporter periplasmic substrate-binding protein n=1 Tax=Candidatus Methanofastidiosum methylothiophilum TaxID=1705564 RepID=A0A150IJY1_9EURY|nr:MAG: molybdate ABC transporter periplasmic substrate-binding protein [Candidatus Methanofastidiosum methylthiophilus]KYC47332.1 MAG: molybdate ABC transporter periplasmic substrate-binding protein [Candidatus Methanofastidiosum methylthiophilus]KYC49783.1 MAG: molybdate ABC transporter periplasmic substrate-binding protein [Candidatus Methanofastidiosum methylthiophilus]
MDRKRIGVFGLLMAVIVFGMVFSGCTQNTSTKPSTIKLNQTGSSTVLPLAIAWAEHFEGAQISVSGGGSSHGFNSLLKGEADLGDASRILKGSDYKSVGCDETLVKADGTVSGACNGILPTKWIVAYDVLAVVVHKENTWANELTFEQLYKIFTNDNPAVYWDEVPGLKEKGAPHAKITIYAPDEASGTYDYFFESIIKDWGKATQVARTRLDAGDGVYNPSADDNVILDAIKSNKYAIGYFGYAYIIENPGQLKVVKVAKKSGDAYVEASIENVAKYPMARPLFIYTNGVPTTSTDKGKAINAYLKYILSEEGQKIVPQVGYVKVSLVDPTILPSQLSKLN